MSTPTRDEQNRSVKVCFVTTELGVGGAERCLVNLAIGLARLGWSTDVVSISGPPPKNRDALLTQLSDHSIPVQFLNVARSHQFITAAKRLRRLLVQSNPEVVVSFLFHANVLTGWTLRHTTGLTHFAGIRVADPRRHRHLVERRICRRVAAYVCVSESVANFCRVRGYPADRIRVIPNGVDLIEVERQRITPLEGGTSMSEPFLFFAGRLDRQKGVQFLPDIATRVWKRHPEMNWVIAGDGPERVELERWADSPEVAGRVNLIGWTPQVVRWATESRCVVIPSLWEGMANVAMEVMAAGCPLVAFRVEGMSELFGPDPTNQLTDPEDLDGMSERISQIVSSKELAEKLGGENQGRIRADFQLQGVIEAYRQTILASLTEAH